jgi:hypothetical protein
MDKVQKTDPSDYGFCFSFYSLHIAKLICKTDEQCSRHKNYQGLGTEGAKVAYLNIIIFLTAGSMKIM